ncbi:MAG TPA: SIR2 family protein [Polyangiaceae bacterium]|nr:SIR2 family protein [Polyangiaceae bacterium]
MTAALALDLPSESPFVSDANAWFAEVGAALRARRLAPYLGSGLSALSPGVAVPTTYESLAEFFGSKVALPKRARGNAWASAQFVESRQHRATVTRLMQTAFAAEVAPLPFHAHLAQLELPLIVDTWYDGAARSALQTRTDWLEIQGINRAQIGESGWFRAYDPGGALVSLERAEAAKTLLYKPHGGITPTGNFLITDADYVEVLTEIDIQNPIPEAVRRRRSGLGFVFLGCRFHDQLLRTYARQIVKRSSGPHYAVFETNTLTRMELRFARELGLQAIACPLSTALERLTAASR